MCDTHTVSHVAQGFSPARVGGITIGATPINRPGSLKRLRYMRKQSIVKSRRVFGDLDLER